MLLDIEVSRGLPTLSVAKPPDGGQLSVRYREVAPQIMITGILEREGGG
jgi:hypothetical protein